MFASPADSYHSFRNYQQRLELRLFKAKYIGVDSSFGRDNEFLASLPKGLIYFADIPFNHLVYIDQPTMKLPQYSGRRRKPKNLVPDIQPLKVQSIAENENYPWEETILGLGSKVQIAVKDKCLRLVNCHNGKPNNEVWLYIRTLAERSLKYALSNESPDASPMIVCKPSLMRWSIEQCFGENKKYLGMDHYQTRSWIVGGDIF